MSQQTKIHPEDYPQIEREHTQALEQLGNLRVDHFTTAANDVAMALQDSAYQLGRERGRQDCAELLEALEALLEQYVEEVQGERMSTSGLNLSRERILGDEFPEAAEAARLIAKAKGEGQ